MPSGGVTPTGGGSPAVTVARTTLTHAQILGLPTSSVAVTPAAGTGKLIMPVFVGAVGPAIAYTNIDATSHIFVESSANGNLSVAAWAQDHGGNVAQLIGSTGSRSVGMALPIQNIDVGMWGEADGADMPNYATLAWQISASNGAAGNYTGGNASNALDVYVYYVTVSA